jgi:hypothetical protein
MAIGLLVAVVARLAVAIGAGRSGAAVGGLSAWDLAAVAAVVVLAPFVEWAIHLFILHREPFRVGSAVVDVAAGHRQHHLNPASLNWVLLRGVDAAASQVANALLASVVIGVPMWLFGIRDGLALAGPVLTGVVLALVALMHYEWAHLMFHTGYRPRTRYYRRLKRNHRLHHWRNEQHWLGITGNSADRVLGTYPASTSDVPLSPTARTLGRADA